MTNEDISVIKELRALTGLKEGQIVSVFEALSNMYGVGNYYNNERIHLPLFGTFKLKFEGDEIENGLRKAQVTGFFTLHDSIKKNVGIIEDYKKTGNEKLLLELDSFKNIVKDTKLALKNTLEG